MRCFNGTSSPKLELSRNVSSKVISNHIKVRKSKYLWWVNLVLSSGLIMWIGHHKEIWKLMFRVLALHQSVQSDWLWWRAKTWKFSFRIPLWWPIHIMNPVDKTKLSCYTSHRHSTTVSFEILPSIVCMVIWQNVNMTMTSLWLPSLPFGRKFVSTHEGWTIQPKVALYLV